MNYEIDSSFARIEHIVPLLHIVATTFIVAIQVAILYLVNFFTKHIDKNYNELFKYSQKIYKVFFILFFIIVVTGFLISNNGDFKYSDPMIRSVINTKYAIAFFVACNFSYIIYRFSLAKKAYKETNLDEMKEHLIIATKYFIVLDICILLLSIYLGVVIVGFR